MTLFDLVKKMEGVAAKMPSISSIVEHDVRKLNELPDVKYGVFGWQHKVHTANVQSDYTTYSFTLFYVDRLTQSADKETSNMLEVQSVGVDTLTNIIRALYEDGISVDSFNITPYEARFSDDCSGVYADVDLSVDNTTMCSEDYTDKQVNIY